MAANTGKSYLLNRFEIAEARKNQLNEFKCVIETKNTQSTIDSNLGTIQLTLFLTDVVQWLTTNLFYFSFS